MDSWKLLDSPAHGIVSERRPLQVDLAKYLHSAMSTGTPCMVEAGTGIGKSFAYLLNAIDLADEGKRVVISTAMKSLQQQLFFKDLPYLATKVPNMPSYARQLGKKNYGCKRFVTLRVIGKEEEAAYNDFFDNVKHWVWEDAPPEIAKRLPHDRWQHSVGYCNGARCDHYDECADHGYLSARAEYEQASIVIANHALVGADMRIDAQHDKQLLGDYDALIVDEAHKYPEAIRNALALQMPAKFFEKAEEAYREAYNNVLADISTLTMGASISFLPATLPNLHSLLMQYKSMFRETARMGTFGPQALGFAAAARQANAQLSRDTGAGTDGFYDFLANMDRPRPVRHLVPEMRGNESLMRMLYYIDEYYNKLDSFSNAIDLAITESLRYVVAVEEDERGVNEIKTLPIHIGDKLLAYYEKRKVVPAYLSATLTVDGKFDYYATEVGHDIWTKSDPPTTFHAGSPFDPRQGWCYVPELINVPNPGNSEAYMKAIVRECYDLLMANEGHAFILFTSFRDMEAVATGLREMRYPYPMLLQSPELKANGRTIFLSTPNATLLGTRSFWEGIDVPGLHLSLVIIPKAPFPNPSDAIVKAKTAIAGDRWFHHVSMPLMLTDLRQMAGRLIRSTGDRGVVALLDTRVHSKNYGPRLISAVGFPWNSKKETALRLLGQLTKRRREQA